MTSPPGDGKLDPAGGCANRVPRRACEWWGHSGQRVDRTGVFGPENAIRITEMTVTADGQKATCSKSV